MMFVLIDTSTYLDCALIRKPHHGPQIITQLIETLRTRTSVLLVPEVVELELDRHWEAALRGLQSKIDEEKNKALLAMQELRKYADYSADGVALPSRQEISRAACQVIKTRIKSRDQVKTLFAQLLFEPMVLRLPLTSDIRIASARRAISGRPPSQRRQGDSDSDGMIVETLLSFFQDLKERVKLYCPQLPLLLCSSNTEHFADDDKGSNGLVIHRALRDDFEKVGVRVNYYASLTDLMEKGLKHEVDREELARYGRAHQLAGPTSCNASPMSSKTDLKSALDGTTQRMLGWTADQVHPVARADYDWAFSDVDPTKREVALAELCVAGLMVSEQGSYSSTAFGRDFLDEVILSTRLLGYKARGTELGL